MELNRQHLEGGRVVRITPSGDLDVHTTNDLHEEFVSLGKQSQVEEVILDLGEVDRFDSAAIATISLAEDMFRNTGRTLVGENMSDSQREALQLMPAHGDVPPPETVSVLEAAGEMAVNGWNELKLYYETLTDTVVATMGVFKGRLPPKGSVTEQSVAIGVDAFPIIALLSFLLGLIMAFQSAYQLRQFGANIYVANLVAISTVREFGPMMTGIMIAGRSGSAITAELSTMKVSEEIDGLRVMGINPSRFLVLPRMIAITIVQPALTLMSDFVGIFGGFLIGVMYLDLSPESYINQTVESLDLGDLFNGLSKSVVFAWIIGTIATYAGMNVRGGASNVGKATTRAVVASIFSIIVADSIFAMFSTLT
ncbi:MAG: MlaE family lipid ABC transporter permease subunit [Myxococcota bacterium]